MRKNLLTFLLISSLTTSLAYADKILHLKDGSILKGRVIQMADGIYSVQTAIGQVEIAEDQIVSMSDELNPPATSAQATTQGESSTLRNHVEKAQGSIMNDVELVGDIQSLAQDPEIMPLLMDPNFMKDMLSYDPQKIQSNPKLQTLMENPKMRALLEKIAQKLAASQPNNP